jgi:hypothetical protein
MLATETSHIHLDERGIAWIDDTNTKVIEVVLDKIAYGLNPEEIHREHPHLSLMEIDAEIEWQVQRGEELARQAKDSPVRKRLRALGKLPSVALYMDVHVHEAITMGLCRRGVDVLTAQGDGARRLADPSLLDRATVLRRILFPGRRSLK